MSRALRERRNRSEKNDNGGAKTIDVGKNTLEQIIGMIRSVPCCRKKVILTGNFEKLNGINYVCARIKNILKVKTSIENGKIIVHL